MNLRLAKGKARAIARLRCQVELQLVQSGAKTIPPLRRLSFLPRVLLPHHWKALPPAPSWSQSVCRAGEGGN